MVSSPAIRRAVVVPWPASLLESDRRWQREDEPIREQRVLAVEVGGDVLDVLLGDAALVAVELSLIGSSDSSDVGNLFKLICAQREQVDGKLLALLQAQSVALGGVAVRSCSRGRPCVVVERCEIGIAHTPCPHRGTLVGERCRSGHPPSQVNGE